MRTAVFGTAIILLFLCTGCDSYSILDQFTKSSDTTTPEPLSLTLQKTPILRGDAIDLYPAGGTKPYSFAIIAEDLYAGTASQSIGSVDAQVYTAGGAIGTIKIQVIDAAGKTASASVVVLPPAPTIVSHTRSVDNKTVSLDWEYAEPWIIDSFLLKRTADKLTFNSYILDRSIIEYDDSNLPPNTTYYYYLSAVSGTYVSLPAEITSVPIP